MLRNMRNNNVIARAHRSCFPKPPIEGGAVKSAVIIKTALKSSLLSACLVSVSHAGNMGAMQVENTEPARYFISGEASYAWKTVAVFHQNFVPIHPVTNGWGGIVSGGIVKPYKNNISFSAEMGWGDYGSFSYTNALVGWNKQSTTYGFDILLGAMYSYKQFDVFFKAGALIENAVIKVDQNLGNQVIGGVVLGQVSSNASNTTIVPTIKAGGIYNINDSIGATVSYIYATGGKLQGSVYQSVGLGSSVTYGITATQLPSFSAVTFGLLYKF